LPPATELGGDERLGSGPLDAYTAFDRVTGTPLWTTRLRAPESMVVQGPPHGSASDDLVVVPLGPSALDIRSGKIVWTAQLPPNERPTDPSIDAAIGPLRGGASLFGGQDDPVTVLDATTGQQRWTAPGSPPYDDVWAVDDGGVYVVDRDRGEIVAYELATGAERWRQPQGEGYVWPWLAGGDTVFTMWWNLESRAADTGEVRWHTDYPTGSSPTDGQRMVSATMNDSDVFVGFTLGTLGGD
jgi:outer membrane protein assembly factor BamB